ncbi:MAG: hypothetical protein ACRD0H_22240 [Actinomycetes bacterium]
MPIAAAISFVKGLLDGLPMPGGGTPNLAAYITPLDPNVESDIPTCYVYPIPGRAGTEQRKGGDGGTFPRNSGPGTPSGFKTLDHTIGIWVVWFMADDDPDADLLVPGFMDAMMESLRRAWPMPVILTDPWTGGETLLMNTGETMYYELLPPHATRDQRFNRYDAIITVPMKEQIQA